MTVKPYRLLIFAALIAFVCYTAAGGRAATQANWSDPELDRVATAIAGHPVQVYCEDDWRVWIANGEFGIAGFTYLERPVVYINPRECLSLHFLIRGEDVGTIYAAEALLVLTHESMHQRNAANPTLGRNEALTECLAMKELRDVAVRLFGIPETEQRQSFSVVARTATKRVRGKTVKVRYQSVVPTTITAPNPYLTRLLADAARWDSALPAGYHGGTC